MEASTTSYVLFLIVGVLLVLIDGQLMRRSGTTYLKAVYPEVQVADSVNQLVTVLFHLVGLGIVALISTIGMDSGNPFQTLITRTGVLLLVLAVTHGVTIWTLDPPPRNIGVRAETHTCREAIESPSTWDGVPARRRIGETAPRRDIEPHPVIAGYTCCPHGTVTST